MGKIAALLLVMKPHRSIAALMLALCLLSCRQAPDLPDEPRVDPAAYDAFYLWPGVRPGAHLRPKILYLLDGEVRVNGPAKLTRLRMGTPRLPGKAVWLVVRADRLDWNAATYAAILTDLRQWQDAGNRVIGLQIDFDAATRGISGYARFLTQLRARLPKRWQLSVTGLMDWSAHGDPQDLVKLAGLIDEVVVQTYQAQTTIPGYGDYFRRMKQFPIPFRVALIENGQWRAPPILERHPRFRGYVVFLVRRTVSVK